MQAEWIISGKEASFSLSFWGIEDWKEGELTFERYLHSAGSSQGIGAARVRTGMHLILGEMGRTAIAEAICCKSTDWLGEVVIAT